MSTAQRVAIVTLPGFNEIDSFVATLMIHSVAGLEYVPPVGESADYLERALALTQPAEVA